MQSKALLPAGQVTQFLPCQVLLHRQRAQQSPTSSFPPTKPMIIKKRSNAGTTSISSSPLSRDVASQTISSSLPSTCPMATFQKDTTSASSPLKRGSLPLSSEELRSKSELLLGALKGSPPPSFQTSHTCEAGGRFIDHSKSEGLKKLLNISAAQDSDNTKPRTKKGPISK